MAELSERDRLYNEILRTVKENAGAMERGLVVAVLAEVGNAIMSASNREAFDILADALNERMPRE